MQMRRDKTHRPVADYIIPIRVDWSKRLKLTNLQTLCHACHNKDTKKMKRKTENNETEKGITV